MKTIRLLAILVLFPAVQVSASTAAIRAEIAAIYKLRFTKAVANIPLTLSISALGGAKEKVSVHVTGYFDNLNRLRIASWKAPEGPETRTYYYNAGGQLIYSFGVGQLTENSPDGTPGMWIRQWNVYWNNGRPMVTYCWRKSLPGNPAIKPERKKEIYNKGIGWHATAADALKASGLKPQPGNEVHFGYLNTIGPLSVNACFVSGRNRPSLAGRKLYIFDAGDNVMVKKRGPVQYIRGLGRFHWYLVQNPALQEPMQYWVFGAFLEPTAMPLSMR